MLSPKYWQNRYEKSTTGWDIGHISPPIKAYVDQLTNKKLKILIPGCGNAHEAAYLYAKGFEQVHLLDWAKAPLQAFQKRHPEFPSKQLIVDDFFQHESSYDLIIEQTFFCAIEPKLRPKYVQQMHHLLKEEGHLAGLLFNADFEGGPPFGGTKEEYTELFAPYFEIKVMETADNSILPRAERELFFLLKKGKLC